MNALILGSNSDIAKGLIQFLEEDGWAVQGWHRQSPTLRYYQTWHLLLIALGRVAPVGLWHDQEHIDWKECIESNLVKPMELLQEVWSKRGKNPSVCFMAGSNPQKPMSGYSAYNAGKMALLKLCEQLDFETPDCKFFALAPGYVPTKIHRATIDSGWKNERIERGGGTSIDKIYDCLKWCIDQPKEVVGGRNICVTDNYGDLLADKLKLNSALFKLRRQE